MSILTKEDWIEIYYALDSKRSRVEDGGYFVNEDAAVEWSKHLGQIMEKIGPDGINMYEEEKT